MAVVWLISIATVIIWSSGHLYGFLEDLQDKFRNNSPR